MSQRERTEPGVLADNSDLKVELVSGTPTTGISTREYLKRNFGAFLRGVLLGGPVGLLSALEGVRQVQASRNSPPVPDLEVQVTRKS